jgi:hypothetical protein
VYDLCEPSPRAFLGYEAEIPKNLVFNALRKLQATKIMYVHAATAMSLANSITSTS